MRLFDAMGPNPRVVRMFLAEKGLEIPTTVMVLGMGQTQSAEHLARNPLGQVPVLETDDGSCISESLAICEYLEECFPKPSLFGSTPEERAQTRMWARRIDLLICQPIHHAFQLSVTGYRRGRNAPSPEGAAAMREIRRQNLDWLDGHLAGNPFLCGERFSAADILFYVHMHFGLTVGQALDENWSGLLRYYENISQRNSAQVSLVSQVNFEEVSGSI